MKGYISAICAFVILWPILFIHALLYLNQSFEAIKKVVCLDFKWVGKADFWFSFIFSLLLAAVLSYSFLC